MYASYCLTGKAIDQAGVPAFVSERPRSMGRSRPNQITLWESTRFPEPARSYPQLRFMGSKHRLLPWIHEVLSGLEFHTALDAFAGSGCVAYLLKAMGKVVTANDFLDFTFQISLATVENPRYRVHDELCERLLAYNPQRRHFVENTFDGIFFTLEDLRFLDNTWANLRELRNPYQRALAIAALVRSCVKRQPRGVFTVAGDPDHYKDGRRDLCLSLKEHFLESIALYNAVVFDNDELNKAVRHDVFDLEADGFDLVYMDPPYVPRSDDNCYVKRYHFLEGLASYWEGPGTEVLTNTMVKKIPKRYTPFSYRRTALDAFDRLFRRFQRSTLVLSYSSNGYPDLKILTDIMRRYKAKVQVLERDHRYHFGTHNNVAKHRAQVREYLVVGT